MHSPTTPKLSVLINPCVCAGAVPEDRPSSTRLRVTKAQRLDRAERQLAAYFERKHEGARRRDKDEAVEATFASIPAYHRGVLSLYHDARTWPDAVEKALGQYAAVAVRLDCADHPAVGPTPTVELAAAERIGAIVAAEGEGAPSLAPLFGRAMKHHERALRAFAKALAAM